MPSQASRDGGKARVERQHQAPVRLEIRAHRPDVVRERLEQRLFVALEPVGAAEHELGGGDDGLAVDDGEHRHLGVRREKLVHGHHQRRVARMQHVVEDDNAFRRNHARGQREIPGEGVAGMLAVDVDEARALAAEFFQEFFGRHGAAVGLPGDAPVGADAVPGAVRLEAVLYLRVGPVEEVDAEGLLTFLQGVRQGDEEAALERADLGDGAFHAHLGLEAQEGGADGGREARGHAGDRVVPLRQVAVDGGHAGSDLGAGHDFACVRRHGAEPEKRGGRCPLPCPSLAADARRHARHFPH